MITSSKPFFHANQTLPQYMQVKEYMSFRKLPQHLRLRISDYYEYRFQGKMFDEAKILSELNDVLRGQVRRLLRALQII